MENEQYKKVALVLGGLEVIDSFISAIVADSKISGDFFLPKPSYSKQNEKMDQQLSGYKAGQRTRQAIKDIYIKNTLPSTNKGIYVNLMVREKGDKKWEKYVYAKKGSNIEWRLHYVNISKTAVENVMTKLIVPKNLSTPTNLRLFNYSYPDGKDLIEDIIQCGVNLGGYSPNCNAYITFDTKVLAENTILGENTLRLWGQIGIGSTTFQDFSDVVIKFIYYFPDHTESI